jgi:hypothetical protein
LSEEVFHEDTASLLLLLVILTLATGSSHFGHYLVNALLE